MLFRILVLFLIFCNAASGQKQVADSILKLLQKPMGDTAHCKTLLNLGVAYEKFDSVKALEAYQEVRKYASLHKMDFFVARGYYFAAFYYNLQGNYTSANNLLEKSLPILEKNPATAYQKEYVRELAVLAGCEAGLGQVEKSLSTHHRIIDLKEKLGVQVPIDYSNLAAVYQRMADTANEHKWFQKALAFASERNRAEELFLQYLNISMYYTRVNQYETAKKYVDTARFKYLLPYDTLVSRLGPDMAYYNYQVFYLLAGNTFENQKQYDSALSFFDEALRFAKEHQVARDYTEPNLNRGHIYFVLKEYKKATAILTEALKQAEADKNMAQQADAHETLSKVYSEMHQFEDAYRHFTRFYAIHDSLSGVESKKYATSLEVKYENAKKESMIQMQQAEIRQKSTINAVLAGASLLSLLIGYLLLRNYKNRQTIQMQRIAELEAEKKLTATESVLEGEENERRRIAKDLHDGLSGMLSGAKFSLQNMKGNLVMTEENQQAFERSMGMLDSSISEMRRVAQNLMPEALIRFGLDAALKDLAEEVNRNGLIRLNYQSMGLEHLRTAPSILLSVYRIVQELVNNIIKHAYATEGLVQLFYENDKLVLNVEDNGKGMEPGSADNSRSMGWKNIVSRTELLQGSYNVKSSPGKGTSINFEIEIK